MFGRLLTASTVLAVCPDFGAFMVPLFTLSNFATLEPLTHCFVFLVLFLLFRC